MKKPLICFALSISAIGLAGCFEKVAEAPVLPLNDFEYSSVSSFSMRRETSGYPDGVSFEEKSVEPESQRKFYDVLSDDGLGGWLVVHHLL